VRTPDRAAIKPAILDGSRNQRAWRAPTRGASEGAFRH
jgi:hypothetical protein